LINLKIEFGNFGNQAIDFILGFKRDSTVINLSINFMDNSGYWMTFTQEDAATSFRQKYASDRYDFLLFFQTFFAQYAR